MNPSKQFKISLHSKIYKTFFYELLTWINNRSVFNWLISVIGVHTLLNVLSGTFLLFCRQEKLNEDVCLNDVLFLLGYSDQNCVCIYESRFLWKSFQDPSWWVSMCFQLFTILLKVESATGTSDNRLNALILLPSLVQLSCIFYL